MAEDTRPRRGAPGRRARGSHPVALSALLIPLAVWLALVPSVAPALGYTLDLDPVVEVVDHVVPGVVILVVIAAALLLRARPSAPYAFAIGAALSLLAGLWATATHVPLLAQAQQGLVTWGAATFHSVPGVVVMVVALAALVPALRNLD